jgi:signal transduction histidine kinase
MPPPSKPITAPLRVLLIDDSAADRHAVVRALRQPESRATPRGAEPEVVQVEDEAGWEQAVVDAASFDVAVVDYQLGWTDGLALLRELRQRCPAMPVVMFSASAREDQAAEAVRAGLDEYVQKTAESFHHLPRTVRMAIERARGREALRHAEEERQRLLLEAQNANRLKDEFLAILSHELRTPLTAILGWAQVLRSGGAADAGRLAKGLAAIERNARTQSMLVADLLDVSRIVTGQLKLEVAEVSLREVLASALETLGPAVSARRIALSVEAAGDGAEGAGGGFRVRGDATRLQQVLWNLLSNAVKFTPPGGRVAVRLTAAGGRVGLEVADSGQGIAAAFLPHVFDRFRQGDMGSSRGHGGLGLGLSLVKQLVELHGGEVAVHSEGVGQGARFVLWLPAVEAAASAHPPAAESPAPDGPAVPPRAALG